MTKDEISQAIERLKAVDFEGTDSYGRLARICNALYQPEYGWTKGACEGLRQALIDLLGQFAVADSAYSDGISDGMEQALTGLAEDELAKYGLMRLPKDADGEPIHEGDVMEFANGKRVEVEAVSRGGFFYYTYDEEAKWTDVTNKRHYRTPTVEDVLAKMLDTWDGLPSNASNEAIIAEYADKLREVMADE